MGVTLTRGSEAEELAGAEHVGARDANSEFWLGLPHHFFRLHGVAGSIGEPTPANLAGNRLRVRVAPLPVL